MGLCQSHQARADYRHGMHRLWSGRFIDEFWREPDFGQPVYWGWMSKGQLLTIPLTVLGVILALRQFEQGAVPKG